MEKMLVFGDVQLKPESDLLKTFDNFDKLDAGAWQKMAAFLKIPAEPFEKRLLKPVLMGAVQEQWYLLQGKVPELCLLNQKKRLARYSQMLEELVKNDGTDLVAPRKKASSNGGAERESKMFRLVQSKEAKDIWNAYKGQKRLIVKAMIQLAGKDNSGCTVKAISETVVETEETVKPSLKNCAFHVNAFRNEGLVEEVDKTGQVVRPVKEIEKPKQAEPAKKEEAPKKKK